MNFLMFERRRKDKCKNSRRIDFCNRWTKSKKGITKEEWTNSIVCVSNRLEIHQQGERDTFLARLLVDTFSNRHAFYVLRRGNGNDFDLSLPLECMDPDI